MGGKDCLLSLHACFHFFVGQRSELLKIQTTGQPSCLKLSSLLCDKFQHYNEFKAQYLLSLRLERMDTVMTRQALFQARVFRKSKITATL